MSLFVHMKHAVPETQKAKGVTFSLKPELHEQLEQRVEQLGYPWTKSSYIASLVMQDLEQNGMAPESTSAKALDYATKAVENTFRRKKIREGQTSKRKATKGA